MKKKKIALVLSVWLGIVIVAELSVRIYCYAKGKFMPVVHSLEHEWEWVHSHLKSDTFEFSSSFTFDKKIGWQNKPGFENKDTKIKINSAGMRSNHEYPVEKTDKKRIVILGDSYTFGSHVANDEIYSHYLEQMSNYEVLNMAFGGSGNDQHLLTYEIYGEKYKPDVVIFSFFVLSYFRNMLSFRGYAKPYFEIQNDELVLKDSHIIPPQNLINEYKSGKRTFGNWHDSYLYNGIKRALTKASKRRLSANAQGWKLLSLMMERFHKRVTKSGAKPLWLIIPNRDVYKEDYRYEPIQDLCEEKCKQLGMPYIRLDETFLKMEKTSIYRPKDKGGHFSANGHKIVAEVVYAFLKK